MENNMTEEHLRGLNLIAFSFAPRKSKRVIFFKAKQYIRCRSKQQAHWFFVRKLLNRGELVSLDREEYRQREKSPEV